MGFIKVGEVYGWLISQKPKLPKWLWSSFKRRKTRVETEYFPVVLDPIWRPQLIEIL
jgi:hypothetical protein